MGSIGACAACEELGRCRLGLSDLEGPPLAPRAAAVCPPEWEGGPTTAHGGWTAAAVDDFLGRLMVRAGHLSVTVELAVRYRRPVPIDQPLELTGHVRWRRDGRWRLGATLVHVATGRELATAEGTWLERGPEHWERHLEIATG